MAPESITAAGQNLGDTVAVLSPAVGADGDEVPLRCEPAQVRRLLSLGTPSRFAIFSHGADLV